ncbi:uncharacterized protein K452DRAFT_283280 [Aplosporella prunicola CBS 121167]|uniref:Uncharacterized protein n=1 Tax=Aplosporella prunicola CBS 121167 TaxID=1176127 RepID=A0A6A6BPD7_9PEZI|nr:uncharacterized protein K452DRAFT_283280 [Aplosporella prunicola CBS 121167]KAF2145999.1 hypothetical protein K452DRAFT_283280 [Aplosporella prunicola CBS 121167]
MQPDDDDALAALNARFPCRALQIQQLAAIYQPSLPSPQTTVVHGLAATGKSSIVNAVLSAHNITHATVQVRECVTGRHLLERALLACLDALDLDGTLDRKPFARCENVAALVAHLQRLLASQAPTRLVLVFDDVDRARDVPATLLPALARLSEAVALPGALSTILITAAPLGPATLRASGVPHVAFPAYARDEVLAIVGRDPPAIFATPPSPSKGYTAALAAEDDAWVWGRFLGVLWDSAGRSAARDVLGFAGLARRLWRPFVAPIEEGAFGTRDFARLLVNRRSLFQGEEGLVEGVVVAPARGAKTATVTHALPLFTKYLLLAAYLASYVPARHDTRFFSQHSAASAASKRKQQRTTKSARNAHKARRSIPRQHLLPSPFPLDRLLAIAAALMGPDDAALAAAGQADVLAQLATLVKLRLLLRVGAAAAGGDALDAGARWRANVSWEVVVALGRSVGVEMAEWGVGGA